MKQGACRRIAWLSRALIAVGLLAVIRCGRRVIDAIDRHMECAQGDARAVLLKAKHDRQFLAKCTSDPWNHELTTHRVRRNAAEPRSFRDIDSNPRIHQLLSALNSSWHLVSHFAPAILIAGDTAIISRWTIPFESRSCCRTAPACFFRAIGQMRTPADGARAWGCSRPPRAHCTDSWCSVLIDQPHLQWPLIAAAVIIHRAQAVAARRSGPPKQRFARGTAADKGVIDKPVKRVRIGIGGGVEGDALAVLPATDA